MKIHSVFWIIPGYNYFTHLMCGRGKCTYRNSPTKPWECVPLQTIVDAVKESGSHWGESRHWSTTKMPPIVYLKRRQFSVDGTTFLLLVQPVQQQQRLPHHQLSNGHGPGSSCTSANVLASSWAFPPWRGGRRASRGRGRFRIPWQNHHLGRSQVLRTRPRRRWSQVSPQILHSEHPTGQFIMSFQIEVV